MKTDIHTSLRSLFSSLSNMIFICIFLFSLNSCERDHSVEATKKDNEPPSITFSLDTDTSPTAGQSSQSSWRILTPSQEEREGNVRVKLTWTTKSEEANAVGFLVYRRDRAHPEMKCLNPGKPLKTAGETSMPQRYVYYDLDVSPGLRYWYNISCLDNDGITTPLLQRPYSAKPKPLNEKERAEIKTRGIAFRDPIVNQ